MTSIWYYSLISAANTFAESKRHVYEFTFVTAAKWMFTDFFLLSCSVYDQLSQFVLAYVTFFSTCSKYASFGINCLSIHCSANGYALHLNGYSAQLGHIQCCGLPIRILYMLPFIVTICPALCILFFHISYEGLQDTIVYKHKAHIPIKPRNPTMNTLVSSESLIFFIAVIY